MKKLLTLSVLLLSIFCVTAQYTSTIVTTNDAHVRDGDYTEDNYGLVSIVEVKKGSSGFRRDAYVKFDIAIDDLSADNVTAATLNILVDEVTGEMAVDVYTCSSDWSQLTINYTNAPDLSTTTIAELSLDGSEDNSTLTIDVTDVLKTAVANGDDEISFVLTGDATTKKTLKFFASEESLGAKASSLVLTTTNELTVGSPDDRPYSLHTIDITTPDNGSDTWLIVDDVTETAPTNDYGGWDKQRFEATGYYHTHNEDGVWYVVDPEGYSFYVMGITSVIAGGDINLPDDIKQYGINTLGNWSDENIANMPFCPRYNFLQNFKNSSTYRKGLFELDVFPVFDPSFAEWIDAEAKTFTDDYKDNPWVFGYHTDNELRFHYVDINVFLEQATSDPHYIAAYNFMVERHGSLTTPTDDDYDDFQAFVASTYMSTVNAALKKYDPDHMNIGCRIHASVKYNAKLVAALGAHVDIMSINFYGAWNPSAADMDLWMDEGKCPFMITEFYSKGEDVGMDNEDGAGWKVNTQEDRASHFENMALTLMGHKGSAGWTYFRYTDKLGTNRGLVSLDYEFYMPLAYAMQNIAQDAYNLRRYLLGMDILSQDSLITELDDNSIDSESIHIYPNPATDQIVIECPGLTSSTSVNIYSISGQLQKSQLITENKTVLNIGLLDEGVYLLSVEGERVNRVERLIIL